jgi:hypothetical protein
MRPGRPIATFLLAMGLVAVSGCEAVQQAQDSANAVGQAADKAQLCVDALKLAGFTPDVSNPQAALDETQRKADELNKLAEKAGDTTLKQAIEGVATKMDQVTLSDLNPQSIAGWTQAKLDAVAALSKACG